MVKLRSEFTEATLKIAAEVEALKSDQAAPTFMKEGTDRRTRVRKFSEMTEFQRMMEIQERGLETVLRDVNGATNGFSTI
jgi:hypothetical protein